MGIILANILLCVFVFSICVAVLLSLVWCVVWVVNDIIKIKKWRKDHDR